MFLNYPTYEEYQETLQHLLDQKPPLLTRIWHWIVSHLDLSGYFGSEGLGFLVFALGLTALVAVAVFFALQIQRNWVGEAKGKDTAPDVDSLPTAQTVLRNADELESQQDFRGALRCLYLAVLIHLCERGYLSHEESTTNREHLAELELHASLQEAVRPIVHRFDDVWYGHKPCSEHTVEQYRQLLQKVHEASP